MNRQQRYFAPGAPKTRFLIYLSGYVTVYTAEGQQNVTLFPLKGDRRHQPSQAVIGAPRLSSDHVASQPQGSCRCPSCWLILLRPARPCKSARCPIWPRLALALWRCD